MNKKQNKNQQRIKEPSYTLQRSIQVKQLNQVICDLHVYWNAGDTDFLSQVINQSAQRQKAELSFNIANS